MVTPSDAAPPRGTMLLCLATVYVIWSSTYLVMRWAVASMPPMAMASVRFLIAGSIMFVIARLRGIPAPSRAQWGSATIVGSLLFIGGNGLVAIAEQTLPSATAAVVCATMPLWLAMMTALTGERPTPRELCGHLLGFAGVVVLVGPDLGSANAAAAAVLLLSPMCWALGSLLSRRLPLATGTMSAASQMLAGGVALAGAAAVRGEHLTLPSTGGLVSLVYLILVGSVLGFTAYAWLIRHTRPAIATSYAFVNPPLAVLVGVLVGGEVATRSLLVATPLIALAVVLVLRANR